MVQKPLSSAADPDQKTASSSCLLTIFKRQLQHGWWVILFALICAGIYERALDNQIGMYQSLQNKLSELETEKKDALVLQSRLLQQINSHSDHDWIELTLMKGLGLCPEDQIKVFYR